MSLRRAFRRAWPGARFPLAVLLTAVVVAYVAVPPVARVADSLGGYAPGVFEPKDAEREAWLRRVDGPSTGAVSGPSRTPIHITLLVLVAIVWLAVLSSRTPPR